MVPPSLPVCPFLQSLRQRPRYFMDVKFVQRDDAAPRLFRRILVDRTRLHVDGFRCLHLQPWLLRNNDQKYGVAASRVKVGFSHLLGRRSSLPQPLGCDSIFSYSLGTCTHGRYHLAVGVR